MIRDNIENLTKSWEKIGHVDLLGKFIIANGTVMEPGVWKGQIGPPKMCYMNAFEAVQENAKLLYVEGYAVHKKFQFPFQHAWVTFDGKIALDPTLKNASEYEYYGVVFDRLVMLKEVGRKKTYGLLTTEVETYNVDLMVRHDPKFNEIVERARRVSGGLSDMLSL